MTTAVAVRPLVRSLDPLPGESLAGYLLRLADRHDRSVIDLTRRLGLAAGPTATRVPAGLALGLSPEQTAGLAAACRLDEEEAQGLTLDSRVGTLLAKDRARGPAAVQVAAINAWISPGRTRYCPDCLRGDHDAPGYWRASWQLPWHYACLRHLRLLTDDCPACGTSVGKSGGAGQGFTSLVPQPGAEDLRFDQCRARPIPGGPTCGRFLSVEDVDDDSEHRAVHLDHAALAAQVRIAELIGLDYPIADEPLLAGEPLSLPLWIAALQGVAVLVRASLGLPGAPQADLALWHLERALSDPTTSAAERNRILHPQTPPDGAWAASSLIARAVAVLDTDSRLDLHDAVLPYREAVNAYLPNVWKSWLRQYPDPDVKALLKRHRRWTGLAASARTASTTGRLVGANIGQRVPPPHDRHLAPFRILPITDTGLHRATCVLLHMRVVGGQRRADAAAALGYDQPHTVDGTVRRLSHALAATGLTDAYDSALTALKADLAAADPVDWSARRAALANWTVPTVDWLVLKADLAPLQKRDGRQPDWDLRRQVISQIIWEDLTASEPRRSPAMNALAGDVAARDRLKYVSEGFRARVADGRLPGMDAIIDAYRARVLARIDGS